MGKKWEELQLSVNVAYQPLLKRRQHYQDGAIKLRELLIAHFIDKPRSLTEAANEGEQVFDFNLVKTSMSACLKNEEELAQTAFHLQAEEPLTRASLVSALDKHVLTSGLPFSLDKDSYQLQFNKPYTKKANEFMQQFAGTLTIYRIYLKVYEIYFFLLNHAFLNSEPALAFLTFAKELNNRLIDCPDEYLAFYLKEAKLKRKEIKECLATIHAEKKDFEINLLLNSPDLVLLLDAIKKMEEIYKQFPNESRYTFWLYDAEWQTLLKTIAGMFTNQYTYNSYASSMTILPAFGEELLKEVTQFHSTVIENIAAFKIELYSECLRMLENTQIYIRAKAASQGMSLVQAPVLSLFSSPNPQPSNIYELMYLCMKRNNYNPGADEEPSNTYETEIKTI